MFKGDSLGWAAFRGDEELTKELLARQRNGLTFNTVDAAITAVEQGHVHLLELLATTSSHVWNKLAECTQFKNPKAVWGILECLPFAQMNHDQLSVMKVAIRAEARDLVAQWIDVIDPKNFHQRDAIVLSERMLNHGWDAEFLSFLPIITSRWELAALETSLIRCVVKADRLDVWTAVWPHPTKECVDNVLTKILEHDVSAILDHVWSIAGHALQQEFLIRACANKKNNIVAWAAERAPLSGHLFVILMKELLKSPDEKSHLYWMDTLFRRMSEEAKQSILELFNNEDITIPHDTEIGDHFQTLIDMETQGTEDKKFHSFKAPSLLVSWAERGHIDLIQQWIDQVSPIVERDVLMAAASAGHLNVVQFIVQRGTFDPLSSHLAAAAGSGHLHVVEYLLPSAPQQDISMASRMAIKHGHMHVFQRLYPLSTSEEYLPFLEWAVVEHQPEALRFLLQNTPQNFNFFNDLNWIKNNDWMVCADWAQIVCHKDDEEEFSNDTFTTQLVHLFPHHPYNGVLFCRAVNNGLLNTARALLDRFDHHDVPFDDLMKNVCRYGDIQMMRMLLPHVDFKNRLNETVGEAAHYYHWALLEDVLPHCVNRVDNCEILWAAMDRPTHIVKAIFSLILPHCDLQQGARGLLQRLATNRELIDLVYHHYQTDQIERTIKFMMSDPKYKNSWQQLPLAQRYEEERKKRQLLDAVGEGGVARKERVM